MPVPRARSKQAALRELQAIHARRGPISVDELPQDLYNDLLHHFGGIHRARLSAGLQDPPVPRKWSLPLVLSELKRLHRSGLTIRAADLQAAGQAGLLGAIHEYAGGIARARRLAKIPAPPHRFVPYFEKWDEDRVIGEIRDLHRRGLSLAYTNVRSRLRQAARRYFGSWSAAIETADLDYDDVRLVRRPYTKAEVIGGLRALRARRPKMTSAQLSANSVGQAAARLFPSIEDALRRAKLKDWPVRIVRDVMPKNAVRRALVARHRAGKSVTLLAIQHDDLRLVSGIRRHYLGIEAAVLDAGLESESPIRWSPDEVVRQLKKRQAEGLPMTAKAVNDAMQMLYRAAIRYFGSYYKVARRLGVKRPYQSWTPEKVITELRRVATRRPRVVTSDLPTPLLKACKHYFGNLGNARIAAAVGDRS